MDRAKHRVPATMDQRLKGLLGLILAASCGAAEPAYVGSKVCERCHASIFREYVTTPMARSSGLTVAGLEPGEVRQTASDVVYRATESGRFEFSRGSIAGERAAAFFIGSGSAARTFLWETDGFLFELPITWFASAGWRASPGYES